MNILEILAATDHDLPLGAISAEAGLNPSTCHHILGTLAVRGFVGRSPISRRYFLGSRLAEISQWRQRRFNLAEVAMPELRRLNEATKESVQLAELRGAALTTLAKLESKLPVRVGLDDEYGAVAASHATATGKAILAWLPEGEMTRVVGNGGLIGFTKKTISTIADLVEELRLVRRRGYSIDDEEFQTGVYCVGAAIRDHSGGVVGSIGASVPRMRAKGEHLETVVRHVCKSGTTLSSRFGSSNNAIGLGAEAGGFGPPKDEKEQ